MRAEKVRALGNWVFLKLDPRREQVGHILLPTATGVEKVGHSTAHVISVGPGTDEVKLEKRLHHRPQQHLSPGDRVVIRDFHRDYNPVDVDVDDEGYYFLLHFNDIEAIVTEDAVVGEWSGIRNEAG